MNWGHLHLWVSISHSFITLSLFIKSQKGYYLERRIQILHTASLYMLGSVFKSTMEASHSVMSPVEWTNQRPTRWWHFCTLLGFTRPKDLSHGLYDPGALWRRRWKSSLFVSGLLTPCLAYYVSHWTERIDANLLFLKIQHSYFYWTEWIEMKILFLRIYHSLLLLTETDTSICPTI